MLPDVAARLGVAPGARVNAGTLDHFAGMIGTGNARVGALTLSTGTVMALAAMSAEPAPRAAASPCTTAFCPYARDAQRSGKRRRQPRVVPQKCMPGVDYARINAELAARGANALIFLPYIAGVNAPDFDKDAVGVFWGLRQEHDAFDMARAVMEGVSFALRKNCDYIAARARPCARSWPPAAARRARLVPVAGRRHRTSGTGARGTRAACLGAAIVAAVSDGRFASLEEGMAACVRIARRYGPRPTPQSEEKYRLFCRLDAATRPANLGL